MKRKRNAYVIHLTFDPPPIPDRGGDWQAHIDQEDETTSVTGPTPSAALAQIAEIIEEEHDI